MNYEDLICLDVELLTPMQAEMANRQIREELFNSLNPSRDQPKLHELLLATQEKASGPEPEPRQEVVDHIKAAKAAGNTRLARQLTTALLDSDVEEDNDQRRLQQAVVDNAKYWAKQEAKEQAEQKRRTQELINIRTQELVYAHGWSKTETECRKIATEEVQGRLPRKDDQQ